MNDNEIRNFFHKNQPSTGDQGTFLAELSARMDAARDIKSIHDATIKKYRRATIITFVAGCILGMAIISLVLIDPVSAPHFSTELFTALKSFVIEWQDVIMVIFATVAMVLGLTPWKNGGYVN